MSDSRLTKIVFKWDKSLNDSGEVSTWCTELKTILRECNMEHVFDQCQSLPAKSLIKDIFMGSLTVVYFFILHRF